MTASRQTFAAVDIAHDARALLGECPIWDERARRLRWVDIHKGLVHSYLPATGTDQSIAIGQPVSALGLGVDGGLVLATGDGFQLRGTDAADQFSTIDVEKPITGNRMNDGRVDAAGRFWAGTMASLWEETKYAGSLYRLEMRDDGPTVTKHVADVTVANGLDWTLDGRSMYYVDSWTQRVDVFDFDPDTGTLGRRRTFVTISPSEGLPDGLVVDADGGVWVALFGAGVLRRYSASGVIDFEIHLPVSLVTSATFGGADLSDLYITTAKHRLGESERAEQPHAGSLFVCRPGFTGRPCHRFRGV
jgi:sugar lactone lactonase YvrE